MISTGAVDRDHETLAVDGWKLDEYRRNPVVLWCHDQRTPPIGRAVSIVTRAGQIRARVEFAPADVHPLAGTIKALVAGGFISATSVGFAPLKYAWNEKRGGMDFIEQELLEFSLVGVPSNPEALIAGKSTDVDLAPLRAWAEGALGAIEPGLWVPKASALRLLDLRPVDSGTVVELARAAHEKRGRVLSAANEASIRDARGGADAVCRALDAVLEQMPMAEDDPAPAPAPEPKAAGVAIRFRVEPTIRITPDEVAAAVQAAVTRTVRAGVYHALGRLED